jgi:hypothetical protein
MGYLREPTPMPKSWRAMTIKETAMLNDLDPQA